MTTAEEYRKQNADQTYKFVGHSGAEFELCKPGPTMLMDLVRASGLSAANSKDATEEERTEMGMKMYDQRESIYPAILPVYVRSPKVVIDGGDKKALSLDEISGDDKWGILQSLMLTASGQEGKANADAFPEHGTGGSPGDVDPSI